MNAIKLSVACALALAAGSAGAQVYFSDFEADGGGFIGTGDWERGIPTGVNGTALGGYGGNEPTGGYSGDFVWGTIIGGLHSASTVSSLSITIDATGYTGLQLTFQEWLDSGINDFDTAQIFVGGTLLDLRDGGPTNGWREVSFDLSAYDNSVFDLEFRFSTTTVVERVGWYIDDVSITGVPTPASIAPLALAGFAASRRRR